MTIDMNNAPVFSVSDLSGAIKKTLETGFGRIRVRGELSGVKRHSSGHCYWDLKDDKAVLNAVCWRGTSLGVQPENGMEVICTGRITSYAARSNYQMVIESMELAGEGALLKLLEDRKKRLAAEGLFVEERKKKLPFFPETIGIITSPTGAVIRDILHRIEDRCPLRVLVWPVAVQGTNAAFQIAEAINGFDKAHSKPDLLIVARGGGSLEDLMPFNEEIVVRAVADCSIPVISAVGHETDTTLIDFAADRRAPTPTAAAEMAVPMRLGLLESLKERNQTLLRIVQRMLEQKQNILKHSQNMLVQVPRQMEFLAQKLDDLAHRLLQGPKQSFVMHRLHFRQSAERLRFPSYQFDQSRTKVEYLQEKLQRTWQNYLQTTQQKLKNNSSLLESYSYHNVLKRGFALIYDDQQHPVISAKQLKSENIVRIVFEDGNVDAKILTTN